MLQTIKFLFSLVFLLFPSSLFSMTLELKDGEAPELYLSGEIERGDAQKVFEAIQKLDAGIDGGTVYLDSPGGDYLEGIMLGSVIFEKAWSTRVEKGKACMSACAFAFLGGRFLGASRGWGPSRQLEAGATLGFHPFYAKSGQKVDLTAGIEAGRFATNLLYAYTAGLGIRQDLMTEILAGSPADVVIVKTPRLLSGLGIELMGYPNPRKTLKASEAANLLENILSAKADDYEFDIKCREISEADFKRDMLKKAADSEQSSDYPEIKKFILQTLKKNSGIDRLYKMLNALGAVPDALSGRIFKVTGLDNIHYYLSKIGYVSVHNEGTEAMAIEYLLCPVNDFSGNRYCESKTLDKKGIIYDIYPADKPLW